MTKTEENLKAAFAGESQARNKYTYFAKVARKEGYNYIAKLFEETADNEKEHAKKFFKFLLVAGLSPVKGVDILIKAFARLISNNKQVVKLFIFQHLLFLMEQRNFI